MKPFRITAKQVLFCLMLQFSMLAAQGEEPQWRFAPLEKDDLPKAEDILVVAPMPRDVWPGKSSPQLIPSTSLIRAFLNHGILMSDEEASSHSKREGISIEVSDGKRIHYDCEGALLTKGGDFFFYRMQAADLLMLLNEEKRPALLYLEKIPIDTEASFRIDGNQVDWSALSSEERVEAVKSVAFDKVEFRNQSLIECLKQLSSMTNAISGRGFSFSIVGTNPQPDLRISMKLQQMTLAEVLDLLAQASGSTIDMTTQACVVTFPK